MLRALALLLALAGSFSAGVFFGPQLRPSLPSLARSGAEPRSSNQTCRDDCEQRAIVYKLPESQMLSCIARCPSDPMRPRETPRSITRAPADHAPEPLGRSSLAR